MSSTSRIGTPLRISWAKVRANRDMQIFKPSGPKTGSFKRHRSESCLPRLERRNARAPKIAAPIPTTRKYHSVRITLSGTCGQRLNEGNSRLDHRGKLSSKQYDVSFFNRANFFARSTGDRFLLERQYH